MSIIVKSVDGQISFYFKHSTTYFKSLFNVENCSHQFQFITLQKMHNACMQVAVFLKICWQV